MHSSVKENAQQHRFELPIRDGLFAAAYYRIEDGQIALIHTEVPATPGRPSPNTWISMRCVWRMMGLGWKCEIARPAIEHLCYTRR
jgi:hypothetical protein